MFCLFAFLTPAVSVADNSFSDIVRIQETSARRLEASLPDEPFATWLAKTLGPEVYIEWMTNDCGEGAGDPTRSESPDKPLCVEANAMGRDGTRVIVRIATGRGADDRSEPSLFALAIYRDGVWQDLARLSELKTKN